MTQIQRGREGVSQTAADALRILTTPGGFDAGLLLGLLKAGQTHLSRLSALGQLTPAQKQDSTWIFTQAVQNLSNAELAEAYQTFSSAEMDLLQTALQREGEINPAARDARMAVERLFDLQALVLRESANRAASARLDDLRAEAPQDATLAPETVRLPRKATEQYGSAGGNQVIGHENDIAAQSLGVLIEATASSATARERSAGQMENSLHRRSFDDVTLKQIGDVMRSKELTVNMRLTTLLDECDIMQHPDRPMDTMWSLKERGIEVKSRGYQQKRDEAELQLFPELNHARNKGESRPLYGAVNFQSSKYGAAGAMYGKVSIVLKPEVARRATFTVNDSFRTLSLTVDKKRREHFFALFGGDSVLPDLLKTAVANPNSPERRALEEWFDKMEAACRVGTVLSNEIGQERDIPKIVSDHFHGPEGSEEQALTGLMIKCFGDPSATRSMTATHENMESLLPHLGQANSAALAQAARDRAQGKDPKLYLVNTAYMEAQIHGPVIPERDIAEIRVKLEADDISETMTEAQKQQARARLEEFSRQTGIRVVFLETTLVDDTVDVHMLSDKTKEINAAHLDNTAIDKRRDKFLTDFPATVARFLSKIKLRDLPDGIDFALRGPVLDHILEKFNVKLQELRTSESWDQDSEKLVDFALEGALQPIVRKKIDLLNEMVKLDYANARQKQAFADWVIQSCSELTANEVRLVHQHATAQANQLRVWATAEPVPDAGAVLAAFSAPLAGEGADPRHVSEAALALIFSDVPPPTPDAMHRLLGILDSELLRGMTAQLDAVATAEHLRTSPDSARVTALAERIRTAASAVAGLLHAATPDPRRCILPLSAIPANVRAAIRQVAPALADALDAAHPVHPAFPAPVNAGALPQTKAQRKEFLIRNMETYRQKELTTERGRSVHGRGHIIRAYFYATAFCNIMKEQGIAVDRNAVILGIIGHDLGRGGLGNDEWEPLSAQMTNQAIRQNYGNDTAGEAYEHEIADSIVGVKIQPEGASERVVPISHTMEAQLLQSADSLDIGRTGTFNQYHFDFLRDQNGTVSPEAQAIRDQLAEEAKLLQQMTNPICANHSTLMMLADEVATANDERQAELMQQRTDLDNHVTNMMIEEANNETHEALFNDFENVIRTHRDIFPILSKYYLDTE